MRYKLCTGVYLNHIESCKFKTNAISVNFVLPLDNKVSSYAIVPYILRNGSSQYQSIDKLAIALDNLYGSVVAPIVRKIGDNLVIGFFADTIDKNMVSEDLLTEVSALIENIIFSPVLEDDKFKESYFKLEQSKISDKIESIINDKRSYAIKSLVSEMCKDEPYSIYEYGNAEDVRNLSLNDAFEAYKYIIENARIEIMFVGEDKPEKLMEIFSKYPRKEENIWDTIVADHVKETREVTKEMDTVQGVLAFGFRTFTKGKDEDYPALAVMNAIFGGGIDSKLFNNVREKLSLCYFASSNLVKTKGLMLASAGIENKKREVAQTAILNEFYDIQKGVFTDIDLEVAIKTVKNTLKSMENDPLSMETFYLSDVIMSQETNIYDKLSLVTREDVIKVANKVKLDTVYFMKGTDNE